MSRLSKAEIVYLVLIILFFMVFVLELSFFYGLYKGNDMAISIACDIVEKFAQ